VLDARLHHLGNDRTPDWPEASVEPEGTRFEVVFESAGTNATAWMLFLRQRSIDNVWRLAINGVEVGPLQRGGELVERWYALPAGSVKAGSNRLTIVPETPSDDIVVGDVRLVERSVREHFDLQRVRVQVRAADGAPLPARITFLDEKGVRPPLFFPQPAATAIRDGVLYLNGNAEVELPRGSYRCFATRGPEWSLSERALVVAESPASCEHTLAPEVDTTGFVACDTHLHTLQFSGHGDASALERQVTLAGEGVELAIATDHNHQTDYAPFQRELGLSAWYTSVVGNEVTTEVGHFNAFPLPAGGPLPPHRSRDLVTIAHGIRALGAQVVILNHPRWPSASDSPFGHHNLDRLLGRFDPPIELPVDATEMINSTTEEKNPRGLFLDWFALLNRGVRIFAVGSSDSHTVGEPVGQGRTYVPSNTDVANAIDVNASCTAIREGRTSISQGIFATVLHEGRPVMGATLDRSTEPAPLKLDVRVRSASWIRPRTLTVFANGAPVVVQDVPMTENRPVDATLTVELPLANRNDAWIVCLVEGDAVASPAWPMVNPYTLAATNPIFVDRDGGGYTSSGAAAAAFVQKADEAALRARFGEIDSAHAVHLAAAWLARQRAKGAPHIKALETLKSWLGPRAESDSNLAELLAR
jgi:hypothetical protein